MNTINCERCGASCRIEGSGNPNAKMLRRSKEPKGLCVNCAVHDWLRNTYPVNLIFTTLSPEALRLEHIQQQFTGIMRAGFADASPDEIDWERIIANWNLPFGNKVKATATNPASQAVLDREPEMRAREENRFRDEMIARDEGFESFADKKQAELDKIVKEELLPLLRRSNR